MDSFEQYLVFQKEVTASKLKVIEQFQKGGKTKPHKRTSKIEIARNVLNDAGKPLACYRNCPTGQGCLMMCGWIEIRLFSAILKKVKVDQVLIRTAPNTFAFKDIHFSVKEGVMINEISRILEQFRPCFSRRAAFEWFVIRYFRFYDQARPLWCQFFCALALY